MSLKRRDIIAWLLILAAAAALAFGTWLSTQQISLSVVDFPSSTEPEVMKTWRDEHPMLETVEDPENSDQFRLADSNDIRRYQRFSLLLNLLGSLLALGGIIVLRQRKSLLGPDGVFLVLMLLSILLSVTGFDFDAPCGAVFLCMIPLMVCLRELWGWICDHCALRWCFCRSFAERIVVPHRRMIWYLSWIVLPPLLFLPFIIIEDNSLLVKLFHLFFMLGIVGLSLACLLGDYLDARRHFLRQLDAFREDEAVEVRAGPYG